MPRVGYNLSKRGLEVLELMAEGLIKQEIAAQMGLSAHSLVSHIKAIYPKLHVKTKTTAGAKALRAGLL